MDTLTIIRKHALANALKYEGKASMGSVIGAVVGEVPDAKKDMKVLSKFVSEVIAEVNKLGVEKQKEELEHLAPELLERKKHQERTLPELPNALDGKVVVRLAPYPSGPLHIGNARPALLNDEYAKRYNGKMLLVLDDTIGSEEKQISPEAYDLIPQGLEWLGVRWSGHIIYKSDRLQHYYDIAKKLIDKDAVYICTCPFDLLRKNREESVECAHRKEGVAQTKAAWQKMLDGFFKEGEAVMRIKTSMQHPNPAFRDRVLFRISERPHARVGTKYRVWPLLEFSWAVDDNLLGITHVLRGKELQIESEMERFIWKLLDWPDRELLHLGLLQLEGVKISKSKSRQEVERGLYTGWDDPRTWSLQSLARRGLRPEAIRAFILSFGMNANEITVPVDNLYTENRKLIEKDALRFFFVHNPKELRIAKAPHVASHLKKHPNRPELGYREFTSNGLYYVSHDDYVNIHDGELVRLMDCVNFTRKGHEFTFHSQGIEEYRAGGSKIVHWLPVQEGLIPTKILMADGEYLSGLAEPGIMQLKEGDIIQFERFGFCRFDHKEDGTYIFWFTHK